TAPELIGDAGHERGLGTDHDEVGGQRARKLEQTLAVLRAYGVTLAELGDTGVPRRGVNLLERRALSELPGQRVLTAAGADDEDLHAAKPTRALTRLKRPALSTIATWAKRRARQPFAPRRSCMGAMSDGMC